MKIEKKELLYPISCGFLNSVDIQIPMKNTCENNCIRTIFLVAITFLYLMVFENGIYGSVNDAFAFDLTIVEVVGPPELPEAFQPYKATFSLKQRAAQVPFYLENTFKCRKHILLSLYKFRNIYIGSQYKYSLSFHDIIPILQKNNTWHQSTDDDAFLKGYC